MLILYSKWSFVTSLTLGCNSRELISPMQEQRLTLRLMRYWELIRKNSPFPEFFHFNSAVIEEIWPYCFMVSVDKAREGSYKYEYMGEPLTELYGQDMTGLTVDPNMTEFPGGVIIGRLGTVVANKAPVHDEGHLVNKQGQLVKYRACLLPLGNEKMGVTHIIAGLSCRYF
jgi:hypothetical protein